MNWLACACKTNPPIEKEIIEHPFIVVGCIVGAIIFSFVVMPWVANIGGDNNGGVDF